MNIGEFIKRRRVELGLTQEELAERVGVKSHQAVQQWESGATTPRGHRVDKIVKALKTTRSAFYGIDEEVVTPVSDQRSAPLVSWVQVGAAKEARELRRDGVAERYVPATNDSGPNAFALTVVGDAMVAPYGPRTYPPGTTIIVDPDLTPSPGRRVIARLEKTREVTFKELVEDAGRRYLKPLNPQYPTIAVNDDWEIVGVVTSAILSEV